MATYFEISIHRNNENLHLRLIGDFDGTSAHQLLDVLKRHCKHTSRVFIHTSSLSNIHPLGVHVFHNNLNILKGQSITLAFTGENASELVPEKHIPFDLTISSME